MVPSRQDIENHYQATLVIGISVFKAKWFTTDRYQEIMFLLCDIEARS